MPTPPSMQPETGNYYLFWRPGSAHWLIPCNFILISPVIRIWQSAYHCCSIFAYQSISTHPIKQPASSIFGGVGTSLSRHFCAIICTYPLGGNRRGLSRRYLNVMITMILGGLWHGAGWTFIIWGGMHGFYLMLNHGWRELTSALGWQMNGRLVQFLGGALTFIAVVIAWVFFRADNVSAAFAMLTSMFDVHHINPVAWVQ